MQQTCGGLQRHRTGRCPELPPLGACAAGSHKVHTRPGTQLEPVYGRLHLTDASPEH